MIKVQKVQSDKNYSVRRRRQMMKLRSNTHGCELIRLQSFSEIIETTTKNGVNNRKYSHTSDWVHILYCLFEQRLQYNSNFSHIAYIYIYRYSRIPVI